MRFKHFIRQFGRGFSQKNHAVDKKNRLAGVELDAKQLMPENFMRMDVDEAAYLSMIASFATKGIVEIGRYNGGSTILLAWSAVGMTEVPVYSVDLAPQNDAVLERMLTELDLRDRVQLITGNSRDPRTLDTAFDVVFIDGDHSEEGCFADLDNWAPQVPPGGHVLLHDCGEANGVARAIIRFLAYYPEFEAIRGPYLPYGSLLYSWGGSVAHLRKKTAP